MEVDLSFVWFFVFFVFVSSGRFKRDVYSLQEALGSLSYVRDAYFSISNTSVANYEYFHVQSTKEIRPIQMQVVRKLENGRLEEKSYLVRQKDRAIGPFEPDTLPIPPRQQLLLRSLQSVRFSFALRDRQVGNLYEECFDWGIHLRLSRVESAYMR